MPTGAYEHGGNNVGIYTEDYRNEYISLTDIARFRNNDDPRFAIQNWMRNRNTIEFLGLWESLHNPNFNRVQFDTFRRKPWKNWSVKQKIANKFAHVKKKMYLCSAKVKEKIIRLWNRKVFNSILMLNSGLH